MSIVQARFELRADTSANWTAANPVLLLGEPGYETDTGKLKFGDGTTPWSGLDYFQGELLETSGAIDGGNASSVYAPGQSIDGGNASGD